MGTRQEIKFAEKRLARLVKHYTMYFEGMLHNAITIRNLPSDVPKRYFLRTLFKEGKIGEIEGKNEQLFLPASGVGIDIYGLPTDYNLIAPNGYTAHLPASQVKIYRINDMAYPIYPYLQEQARKVAELDMAIAQNLDAIKTATFFRCKDQKEVLSLQNASYARRIGATVIFGTEDMASSLEMFSTGATYYCDKLYELRKEIINETLNRMGTLTANDDKRERVQTAEVDASACATLCNINVIIDTFNYDAKIAGSPLRMELNTCLGDVLSDEGKDDTESNKDDRRDSDE